MISYILIEDSVKNCMVHLDEGGLLDVAPINKNEPYSFQYWECYGCPDDTVEHRVDCDECYMYTWDSSEDIFDDMAALPPNPIDFEVNNIPKMDSNHGSSFKF